MNLNTTYIDAFIHGTLEETDIQTIAQVYQTPDPKRKDVVVELKKQLQTIVDQFPVFNPTLWHALFADQIDCLNRITILPIVGETASYSRMAKEDDQYYLILDLHLVANFTQIISQMVYILQNHIMSEVTKIMIQERYPSKPTNFQEWLDSMTFIHGLANWLSWNEDCKQYKFYTYAYEAHKEQAFGFLAQAYDVDNKAIQQQIMKTILKSDFWKQYPSVAGMFFFDDVYHELKEQGIVYLYQRGPASFIKTIFEA